MPADIATVLLWMFVITLGIAFGAGIYEHRIVTPRWIRVDTSGMHWIAAAAREDNTGLRFWAYVTTGPLTLLTLANLFVAWTSSGPARVWWLVAALAALVDRILTFTYFIPTMVSLLNAPDSPASVARATRWSSLNYLRHVAVLVAWLAALEALAMFYAGR